MQTQYRFGGTLTATIKWLLILNVALFLLQNIFLKFVGGPFARVDWVTYFLGLFTGRVLPWYPHTLLTYSFLHGGLWHLFFNMLILYFFGGNLDLFLGRRRFLILYLGSALAGGVAAAGFLPSGAHIVIGASAAVYGVLTAYAVYFPRTEVLVWFLFPIRVRVLVLIVLGISLFYSVFQAQDGVAHLAHLGGILFAFLYVYRVWRVRELAGEIKHRLRRRRFKRIK